MDLAGSAKTSPGAGPGYADTPTSRVRVLEGKADQWGVLLVNTFYLFVRPIRVFCVACWILLVAFLSIVLTRAWHSAAFCSLLFIATFA